MTKQLHPITQITDLKKKKNWAIGLGTNYPTQTSTSGHFP